MRSGSRSAAWSYGIPTTSGLTGPDRPARRRPARTFVGESGNPGIHRGHPGYPWYRIPLRTGYAEGAWAAAASSPTRQRQIVPSERLGFHCPTNQQSQSPMRSRRRHQITYGDGLPTEPRWARRTPNCQLFIHPSTFVEPADRRLSDRRSELLAHYGKNNGSHLADLKKMVQFIGSNAYTMNLRPLEYTPASRVARQENRQSP